MISTFCKSETDIVHFLESLWTRVTLHSDVLSQVPVCAYCPGFLSGLAFIQDVLFLRGGVLHSSMYTVKLVW